MASRNVSHRKDVASEGVCIKTKNKGSVVSLIHEYAYALKTACSLANAKNLKELRKNVRAIRVSTMSDQESETLKK